MFYVDSVIAFNLFSELLWNYTLIVPYRLNSFQPPQVNYYDIRELLLGEYTRLIQIDKMVYIDNGNLLSGIFLVSHLDLTLFPFCNGVLTCSSPRHPLFLHALSFECTTKFCINFSTNFQFIFTLKQFTTQFSNFIVSCTKNNPKFCAVIQ